ncbi:MAG: glycosyltransferase, partial [Nanoarchaeota archaeon]
PGDSFYRTPAFGIQPQGKQIIVRAHDIDIHTGNLRGVQWNWVTDLVFVAKHLMDKALSETAFSSNVKVHLIKHGIDLNKFTFGERQQGDKIAWIGNINEAKNLPLALYIMAELPRNYILYVVGKGLSSWKKYYVENYIKDTGINVQFSEQVNSINDFLQDKNYLLHTSGKEAFSYVVGEACAMGINPIIHNFWGSSGVWPKEWIWNTIPEAIKMIQENNYDSFGYKNYIERNYPFELMIQKYNELVSVK